MEISHLNEGELRALNQKVVERLRFLQQEKAHKTMLQFNVGERTCFEHDGQLQYGTLTRFNKKSVTIITDDNCKWTVHPSFLVKLDQKSSMRDVTPRKTVTPVRGNDTNDRLQGKVSRNAPCPCGSGKKYKRCCANSGRVNYHSGSITFRSENF